MGILIVVEDAVGLIVRDGVGYNVGWLHVFQFGFFVVFGFKVVIMKESCCMDVVDVCCE